MYSPVSAFAVCGISCRLHISAVYLGRLQMQPDKCVAAETATQILFYI